MAQEVRLVQAGVVDEGGDRSSAERRVIGHFPHHHPLQPLFRSCNNNNGIISSSSISSSNLLMTTMTMTWYWTMRNYCRPLPLPQ